jgi:hypothetical protein
VLGERPVDDAVPGLRVRDVVLDADGAGMFARGLDDVGGDQAPPLVLQ